MWGVGFGIDFSPRGLTVVSGDSDWSLLENVCEYSESALFDLVVIGVTA